MRTSDNAGDGDFTIAILGCPAASTSNYCQVSQRKQSAPSEQFGLQANFNSAGAIESGTMTFLTYEGSYSAVSEVGWVDGRWHLFTGRRAGTELCLFRDTVKGTPQTFTVKTVIGFDSEFSVAGAGGSTTATSSSRTPVSFVAGWNSALPDDAITQLFEVWPSFFAPRARRTYVDLGGGGLSGSQASAWAVLTRAEQTAAWGLLAAASQASGWAVLTRGARDAAWAMLAADSGATGWAVLSGGSRDIAWADLTAAELSSAWATLTSGSQETAWADLDAASQETAWQILNAGQASQALAWAILTRAEQSAAWAALARAAQPTAWATMTRAERQAAWAVLTEAVRSTGWAVLTRQEQEAAWQVLAAGVGSQALAWAVGARAEALTAWSVLTGDEAATGWRVLTVDDADLSWRIAAAASADLGWALFTRDDLSTAWAIGEAEIPEPARVFLARRREFLVNARTRTLIVLARSRAH